MGDYKYVKRRDHPLTTPSGRIPEHRVLLFDKIGPGTHACHHCATPVTWTPGGRTGRGVLVVDHLDGDRRNNAPVNLVPSCHTCNATRTERRIQMDECFLVTGEGKRVRAESRTCETCKTTFLHRLAAKGAKRGLYCSRSCRAKAPRRRRE